MNKFSRMVLLSVGVFIFGFAHADSYGKDAVEKKTMTPWSKYKVEWYQITDSKGRSIPYILILPNKKTGKKIPCVIALHAITASKWDWTEISGFSKGGNLTESLLEQGYAVFAIDLPLHGDRADKVYADFKEHFRTVTKNWEEYYHETVSDIYTSIEYIKKRPEIDSNRLVLIGYSLGSVLSLEVSKKLPDGIRTVVVCVPPQVDNGMEFLEKNSPKPKSGMIIQFAQEVKAPSILMIVGNNDEWSSLAKSREVFSKLKITDKNLIEYESGHSLPVSYVDEVIKWIKERI